MGNHLSKRKVFSLKPPSRYENNVKTEDENLNYFLPNFEKDTEIMVIMHFLTRFLFQGNFNAPIKERLIEESCKVLDVGCGPGSWLLDMASIYRSPSFFGVDLFPIYPSTIKPSNVSFTQCDILAGIPFENDTFDYVHQGNMLSVFTLDEWQFVVSELIRVCKPGGYVEFTEPELATNTGPILTRFYDALIELSDSRNVTIRISKEIIRMLESSPTVTNVKYERSIVPLGQLKGGNAGQAYFEVHDGFFLNEPMPETLSKFMGLSVEEYLKLFEKATKEINNEGVAPDCSIYRVWCQKI